jgi:hypothetical protein
MERQPIVEQCEGCKNVMPNIEPKVCSGYEQPAAKWRAGVCPRASNLIKVVVNEKKVNPLKAAKRARKNK